MTSGPWDIFVRRCWERETLARLPPTELEQMTAILLNHKLGIVEAGQDAVEAALADESIRLLSDLIASTRTY